MTNKSDIEHEKKCTVETCTKLDTFEYKLLETYRETLKNDLEAIIDRKLTIYDNTERRLESLEKNAVNIPIFNKWVVSLTACVAWIAFAIVIIHFL